MVLLWRSGWDSTSAAAEATSGCDMPPACRQEPSGSNPMSTQKEKDRRKACLFLLAQRVGFEPTSPMG